MSDAGPSGIIYDMADFTLIDIETPFSLFVEDGIRELAAVAVSNGTVVDQLHLAIITDQEKYKEGYGAGLEAIESNKAYRLEFQSFLMKYNYPLVAHYASFEKRFLSYWNWIDESQTLYCSLRAIRKSNPGLSSYKLSSLLQTFGIDRAQTHTAYQDVLDLLELLRLTKPQYWLPVGYDYDPEYEKQLKEERSRRFIEARNNPLSSLLEGKKVVFTGKMEGSRTEMMEIAVRHGGAVADSVSKKTDLLVVGEDAGSKLSKAIALDIKIISERDFWKLVGKNSLEKVR